MMNYRRFIQKEMAMTDKVNKLIDENKTIEEISIELNLPEFAVERCYERCMKFRNEAR